MQNFKTWMTLKIQFFFADILLKIILGSNSTQIICSGSCDETLGNILPSAKKKKNNNNNLCSEYILAFNSYDGKQLLKNPSKGA